MAEKTHFYAVLHFARVLSHFSMHGSTGVQEQSTSSINLPQGLAVTAGFRTFVLLPTLPPSHSLLLQAFSSFLFFFFENDDTRHKEITIPDIIAKLESILGVLFLGWVENGTEFLVVTAASQNNQEALK